MDQEKAARQSAENRLLEVEKYKSELSVDIKQYELQINSIQNEYRNERDKVGQGRIFEHLNKRKSKVESIITMKLQFMKQFSKGKLSLSN